MAQRISREQFQSVTGYDPSKLGWLKFNGDVNLSDQLLDRYNYCQTQFQTSVNERSAFAQRYWSNQATLARDLQIKLLASPPHVPVCALNTAFDTMIKNAGTDQPQFRTVIYVSRPPYGVTEEAAEKLLGRHLNAVYGGSTVSPMSGASRFHNGGMPERGVRLEIISDRPVSAEDLTFIRETYKQEEVIAIYDLVFVAVSK